MHKLPRTLLATGFCLLLSAAVHPLRAQTAVVPDGPDPIGTITTTTTTTTFYVGDFNGTVTQTTPAGQVSTGTFALHFGPADAASPSEVKRLDSGRFTATIILNGVTTNYTGRLARDRRGVRTMPGIAYLRPIVDASTSLLAVPDKIPLFINVDVAYGGTQDETGTSLTFRATRDAFVISTGGGKRPH